MAEIKTVRILKTIPITTPSPEPWVPVIDESAGRLEHTEHANHKSGGYPHLKLSYKLYISAAMDDLPVPGIDSITPTQLETLECRIMSGDLWAWCYITVQVTVPSYNDLKGEHTIGPCSYDSLGAFLAKAGAFTMLKVWALRHLSKQINEVNRKFDDEVTDKLRAMSTAGKGDN